MISVSEQLNQFGWDEWFEAKAQEKILPRSALTRMKKVVLFWVQLRKEVSSGHTIRTLSN